jgi:succinyl-diaminopimelate desuccinylase
VDLRERLRKRIEDRRGEMIEMQRDLTAVPALGPDNGGTGEAEKARVLAGWVATLGLGPCENHPAPDPRVPGGERPNLVVTLPGRSSACSFWIMTHMDIVPPGELSLWESDPYSLVVRGDTLVGRGVEDNQQSLVASLFAAACLQELGLEPARTTRLLFVSDEETGSAFGAWHVARATRLFTPADFALVPDSGCPDGSEIEIAEKSILWLRVGTRGKQCHGSTPQKGRNAFEAASHLVVRLGALAEAFPQVDRLFDPPVSTFAPTKKEANVPNVNTIPGDDAFCMDCRVLPSVDLEAVLGRVRAIAGTVERDFGVTVEVQTLQRASSPATPADSPVVTALSQAIRSVYGVQPRTIGIGGGTVGAVLRSQGIPTAVWSRVEERAHQPNESCLVSNMIGDAVVMGLLMRGEG